MLILAIQIEQTIFFPIINTVCKKLKNDINIIDAIEIENLELKGMINKRLKKPNSLSNIILNPEFKALVNAVNTIIPELKNTLYELTCVIKLASWNNI